MLGWEKELAGTYLSDHPLQKHLARIKAANATLLGELDETMHGKAIKVVGMINSVRPHQTKKGEPMAFVEIEDIQAAREIVVFPRAYAAHKELLNVGNLIMVQGKVDAPEGRDPKILADSITNEITIYGAAAETSVVVEAPATPLFPTEPALPMVREKQNGYHFNNEERTAHGNGSNGNAPAEAMPLTGYESKPPSPETNPAPHRLHITLPRSGNLTTDKHRLKTVYNLLIETPGNDLFFFYIPNGNSKIQIEFPNQTTHYTARLEQQLTQILGAKALRVE
jgi:hypothetical protein